MTTVTESGVSQSPHDVMGGQLSQDNVVDFHSLPDMGLKQSTVPLFSQSLLTVEQLAQISVDPDVQAAVDHFIKGLTTQMFAKIVRNGAAEVGQWLGAKVQSERDGWTAMVRMAMNRIEFYRKNALQGQVILHNTLDQLLMLVECFQPGVDVKNQLQQDQDTTHSIHQCLSLLADLCNALMEDHFQCVDILGCTDNPPESLSTAVRELKNRLQQQEAEKDSAEKSLQASKSENHRLRQQNEEFCQEVHKMEEKMRKKQEDLEGLKAQLKEIDSMVKSRKSSTMDKCVGSPVEMVPNTPALPSSPKTSKTKVKSTDTQTFREASLIEVSEEKLRVLKERAKKLESSLHGAIATMDKLRKAAPPSRECSKNHNNSSSTSSTFNTATLVTFPSHRERKPTPKSWTSASFQVTNAAKAHITTTASKNPNSLNSSDRRCFSERPAAGKTHEEQDVSERTKGDSRRTNRLRTSQVSKCLRCQKLFTATDNHKLACCFHSKGKERMEVYNEDGQLLQVQYLWKCCHHQGDNDGCCYGQHV